MKKFLKSISLIKNLVVKDIIFNIKAFTISVLFSLATYTILSFDSDKNPALGIYLSLMILFTNYIGKSCLIEEKDLVYNYLKTLPLKKSYIVLGKYIGSLLVILISYLTFVISKFIILIFRGHPLSLSLDLTIMFVALYIIYSSLYLSIFFKYNYSAAQNTVLVLFLGMFIVFKYFKDITSINSNILSGISGVNILLTISLILFFISYKIAVISFLNKTFINDTKMIKKLNIFGSAT